jgi:hypothetical protein
MGRIDAMTAEIEEFGKKLVEWVRDTSIRSNDSALSSAARHAVAKRWAKAARDEPPEGFARVLIPDIVDDTIFYLLQAIDQGEIRLRYTASNGTVVDLTEDGRGELSGWFVGSESWREKYSNARFVDDCADLG